MKAIDFANYIVWYANKTYPNIPLTHLKLQKLIYYFCVLYAREKNHIPFNEKINKWQFGPVVSSVYDEFKVYGANPIKNPSTGMVLIKKEDGSFQLDTTEFNVENYPEDIKNLMNSIVDKLIDTEPFTLVDRTHEDDGWKYYSHIILAGDKTLAYTLDEIINSKYPNYS